MCASQRSLAPERSTVAAIATILAETNMQASAADRSAFHKFFMSHLSLELKELKGRSLKKRGLFFLAGEAEVFLPCLACEARKTNESLLPL